MNEPATDVTATVAYSTDKWFMDRIPWALWACVAGFAIVLHAEDRTGTAAALAAIYLALLGIAFAGWALTALIGRSGVSFLLELPVHLLIFSAVVIITIAVAGSVGDSAGLVGRLRWSMLLKPPEAVLGWMLVYLGMAWTAFAVFRHYRPARTILVLTPAGVFFHRSWLRDLHIPWQDIHRVGPVELDGIPATNPNVIVVTVEKNFYEQTIAPRRSFFEPPGTDFMFRPKGEMMQMALTSAEISVSPDDYRLPIEARWMAFRDQPRSAPHSYASPGRHIVLGRWSIDGSLWQSVWFAAPLLGMIAVVLHARGIG